MLQQMQLGNIKVPITTPPLIPTVPAMAPRPTAISNAIVNSWLVGNSQQVAFSLQFDARVALAMQL